MMGLLSSVGSTLSGVGSVVGAVTGIHNAKQNRDTQKEFAQKGLGWRVQDAKANGYHPIYALGYNGHSFTPVGLDNGTDFGLQGLGQSISQASQSQEAIDDDSVLFQKENNRLTLQGQELDNQMKALEVQQKWKQLNSMGQSPAFKGLNPFAVPDSTPSPVGNGQAVSSGQVRVGYGFDEPISAYSFQPRPDGTIDVLPSKDRMDWASESSGFIPPGVIEGLRQWDDSQYILEHLKRKYGREIFLDIGTFGNPRFSFKDPADNSNSWTYIPRNFNRKFKNMLDYLKKNSRFSFER